MIFDWDDMAADDDSEVALRLLYDLKHLRPDFKATLFTIPGKTDKEFLKAIPDWLELAVHGWMHPDPHECQDWTYDQMLTLMDHPVVQEWFVRGFKAPGWQISDECYEALFRRNWWCADQPYNDDRRPVGLRCHLLGGSDHWHGHVGNVEGNGIVETWDQVVRLVTEAESFEFMSEAVKPWASTRTPSALS